MSHLRSSKRRLHFNGLKEYIDRRMTIKHLRILAAIARYGKLSEAAQNLNTTTSNVSKTLKEIDDFIGDRLFVRNNGLFKETERSRHLLKLANDIFSAMDKAKNGLDQHQRIAPGIKLLIGYYRTLMSSRAHALWSQLVRAERPSSVMLLRLTRNDLLLQERQRQEFDIVFSSGDLHPHLDLHGWRIMTRPLQEIVFITGEEHRTVQPRHFLLPACSDSVIHVLIQHITKHFPDHDAISYYESLHSVMDLMQHPGTCLVVERLDGQRIADTMPVHIIQSMDSHGLCYQAAVNVRLLESKGILNDIESMLQDISASDPSGLAAPFSTLSM